MVLFHPVGDDPWRAEEQRDFALAALAFEHEVSIAVLGARVRQLATTGGPGPVAEDARAFRALAHHGLRELLVSDEDLRAHGLAAHDLAVPVSILGAVDLAARIAAHPAVVPL